MKFSLLALVGTKRITVKKNRAPEGATRFYVRYTDENGKRHEDALGPDFKHAVAEAMRMKAGREYQEKTGEALPVHETPVAEIKKNISIELDEWLDRKAISPEIARGTIDGYRNTLAHFVTFLSSPANPRDLRYSSDLTPDDMFRFARYLHAKQFRRSTCYTHFLTMMILLKGIGVRLSIPHKQWGEPSPRKAQAYTTDELDALFRAATLDEEELFKSFFYTGMRDQEMAHLTYGDINFHRSLWSVEPKDHPGEESNWRAKSRDSVRRIPVPNFHTRAIRERMERLGKKENDLVFPNSSGGPHQHYWRVLQELAKRAKVTGRVDIHKFRSTRATIWLRSGIVDVHQVKQRLGHSDLKTLDRYIELVNLESEEVIEKENQISARWAPKPQIVRAVGD